jgi:hypothetical protein
VARTGCSASFFGDRITRCLHPPLARPTLQLQRRLHPGPPLPGVLPLRFPVPGQPGDRPCDVLRLPPLEQVRQAALFGARVMVFS